MDRLPQPARGVSYSQYTLLDDPPRPGAGPLRWSSGRPGCSSTAARASPACTTPSGCPCSCARSAANRVEIFGGRRTCRARPPPIESKAPGASYRALGSVAVNPAGYFRRVFKVKEPRGRKYRVTIDGVSRVKSRSQLTVPTAAKENRNVTPVPALRLAPSGRPRRRLGAAHRLPCPERDAGGARHGAGAPGRRHLPDRRQARAAREGVHLRPPARRHAAAGERALGLHDDRGEYNARRKPAQLHYLFDQFDSLVDEAADNGIRVHLSLTGPAPRWARPKASLRQAWYKPSAREFGKWAGVVAEHFAGRVDRYSIWNEPNWRTWLGPIKSAPALYRGLYTRGYAAIKKADPRAKVLIGETSPYGRPGLSTVAAGVPAQGRLRQREVQARRAAARR